MNQENYKLMGKIGKTKLTHFTSKKLTPKTVWWRFRDRNQPFKWFPHVLIN